MLAWDFNHRTPRFFSKWSQTHLSEPKFNHNMTMDNMVWASATTPYYFKPAVIDGADYISGDNVALSPAMYAYYYANERKNIKQDKIRIVSIGATNEEAEVIKKDAGLLSWAARLTSLNGPVKMHTMDYMTDYLLRRNGHELHKFEIQESREWEENFYYTQKRLPVLEQKSQDMIFQNRP